MSYPPLYKYDYIVENKNYEGHIRELIISVSEKYKPQYLRLKEIKENIDNTKDESIDKMADVKETNDIDLSSEMDKSSVENILKKDDALTPRSKQAVNSFVGKPKSRRTLCTSDNSFILLTSKDLEVKMSLPGAIEQD